MWAKASEKTKYEAKLKQYNIKYLKKYGLADEKDKDESYLINSFKQIGWPDPFPEENIFKTKFKSPKTISDPVYAPIRF